jgi:hypothetical protein
MPHPTAGGAKREQILLRFQRSIPRSITATLCLLFGDPRWQLQPLLAALKQARSKKMFFAFLPKGGSDGTLKFFIHFSLAFPESRGIIALDSAVPPFKGI